MVFSIVSFLVVDHTPCSLPYPQGREILMKMMEVFILKFQTIAEYQIPEIFSRWYVDDCMYTSAVTT